MTGFLEDAAPSGGAHGESGPRVSGGAQHEAPDVAPAAVPVVAIGASAGGLAALESVFADLPQRLGAAYVVIQHLSPNFESHMKALLARVTSMPILQSEDGAALEADHVYLIPPKKEMILSGGKLLLTDKDPRNAPSLPIDTFLRSLAQDAGERAVAVILSGTGSDGARGVRAVKNAGGLVIVQDPVDAEFDGMPHNAVATGVADAVLPADEIAPELARVLPLLATNPAAAREPAVVEHAMQTVLDLLSEQYNVDFSCYKSTMLMRRLRRRIEMAGMANAETYADLLATDPEERKRLYQDLLIGVTQFFRDPQSYEELDKAIRAQLFNDPNEMRVWVAGCATGEEVYSIAMLLDEIRAERGWTGRVRIFATDVNHDALKKASAGVYAAEAVAALPRERRDRYFVVDGDHYRVTERLREMVIFATHNVITDAPFTQLDMICCRNVLIYFQPPTQARVVGLFHFGLRTGGLLFLGPSETLGKFEDEFDAVSAEGKIFAKRRDLRLRPHATLGRLEVGRRRREAPTRAVIAAESAAPDVYESLLERYMPMAFLLNESFQLQHCFRGAESLLALRGGRMSTALTNLLEGRMRTAVSGLLERYKQQPGTHAVNLRAQDDGEPDYRITVSALPLRRAQTTQIVVELRPLADGDGHGEAERLPAAESTAVAAEYVEALERDLELARGQLQSTVEELEAANEELQAANEELIASNEELQSTNEELRSVNEELNTVNTDHQSKISSLIEVTDDLENLLHAINVGVLFLDEQMCIRRANRQMGELLHILPQDVGRSFAHFKNNLDVPGVFETAQRVLETGEPAELELITPAGRTLRLNVVQYASQGALGVVLTIVDVTSLRAAEAEARRLSAIVLTSRDAITSHALDGRILSWNHGAERLYGYDQSDAIGKPISLIVPPDGMAETEHLLAEAAKGNDVPPVETTRIARDGTRLSVLVSVAPIRGDTGTVTGASMIALDITARRAAEERAATAVEQREKFLALLSHELRNPLMAIGSANELLSRCNIENAMAREAQQVISRQITQMSRLLEDTLDASRMRHDKIELQRRRIDLRDVIEAAMDATRPRAVRESVNLQVQVPQEPVYLRADAARLQQLIVNLLQNAINHSLPHQSVGVLLEVRGDNAVVAVQDEGEGISLDALPAIFEPFVQASRRSGAGMGLGLSLARSIARAHGGDVVASSDGLGKGARFEVRLPLEDTVDGQASVPAGETVPRRAPAPPSVLLIDDDDASRRSLGMLLRTSGYDVREAPDGETGLRLIDDTMPTLAIIDIGLPDVSGLEIARRVRAKYGPNQIRLVALTGFGRQADREAAIEAGCDMHLVKPIDFATLERVIAYQVAR